MIDVLVRRKARLVILREAVDSAVTINGHNQSCGGIGFAMIKSGDAFPVRRKLKVGITDADPIGMAVQGLREYQLVPTGLMNDFLFAVLSCLGAVF